MSRLAQRLASHMTCFVQHPRVVGARVAAALAKRPFIPEQVIEATGHFTTRGAGGRGLRCRSRRSVVARLRLAQFEFRFSYSTSTSRVRPLTASGCVSHLAPQCTARLSRGRSYRVFELCARTHASITLQPAVRDSANVSQPRRDHVQQEREPVSAAAAAC